MTQTTQLLHVMRDYQIRSMINVLDFNKLENWNWNMSEVIVFGKIKTNSLY